jgi:CHAT domain-containing protein
MASSLRLADGWLSFEDVARQRFRAELVVLSACHAGVDRILSGDEQYGLGRALLHAGAGAVLTTLWAVSDRSMADWMGHFYRRLLSGSSTAEAFREASLHVRERSPHPYSWAQCVLTDRAPGRAHRRTPKRRK